MLAKQPKPETAAKAETPGPSDLQPQNVKERGTETQKTVQTSPTETNANVRSAARPLTDRGADTARAGADWPHIGLAQASTYVRHRICIEYVINPMLNSNQLGMDFATT
ncbi:hypothetical protein AAVH_43806, partial [Aphelenchoides avenae]